ncbi:MAG TPA: hypothetical protein VGM44_14145 [Polyangiaceae bacterium]|jgi:hypothetical protein
MKRIETLIHPLLDRTPELELTRSMRGCTMGVDWSCVRARSSVVRPVLSAFFSRKSRRGTRDALGARQSRTTDNSNMGTELIIVGITVAFYGLCALFVRVCDRI